MDGGEFIIVAGMGIRIRAGFGNNFFYIFVSGVVDQDLI